MSRARRDPLLLHRIGGAFDIGCLPAANAAHMRLTSFGAKKNDDLTYDAMP